MGMKIACGVVCLVATSVQAQFLLPTHWGRGDAYSTYQQWETFTTPAGPNPPNTTPSVPADSFNPNGTANVFDTSGGSFITSGGNIYSFSVPIEISIAIPEYDLGGDYVTTVILQTRTLGVEPRYEDVVVTSDDFAGPTAAHSRAELSRVALGGFGGVQVDYAWRFELPESPRSFVIKVDASGSSMSLDRVVVDSIVTRRANESPLQDGMNATIGFVSWPMPLADTAPPSLLNVASRKVHTN